MVVSTDKYGTGEFGLQNPLLANNTALKDGKIQIELYNAELRNSGKIASEFAKDMDSNVSPAVVNYFKKVDDGTPTQAGLVQYLKDTGNAFGFAAMKATLLNTAMNMGIGLAIGFAFKGLTALLDNIIVTQDELNEKAQGSYQAYEDTKQQLNEVNAQLDDNKKKVEELQAKGTLTYVEQSELDKLKNTTKELETQKKLLENQVTDDARQSALDTANASKKYSSISGDNSSVQDSYEREREFYYNTLNSNPTNTTDDVIAQVVKYEELNRQLSELSEGTEAWANKNAEVKDSQTKLNDLMTSINTDMTSYGLVVDEIKSKEESLWDSNERKIMDSYNRSKEYYDMLSMTIDPNAYNASTFDKIFDTKGIELTKEKILEMSKAGENIDEGQYPILTQAIKDASFAAEDGKDNIAMFNDELIALGNTTSTIDPSIKLSDGMSETVKVLETMEEKLESLADLQDALGTSFSLSRDEALEFASIYPELLQLGEVTSKGLMTFNAAEVKDFINGKEAELKADGASRETQLLNAKATLEAKVAECDAKLSLAESVANGELEMNAEQIDLMANARQQLIDYLIECGVTQVEAERAANAAMTGDMEAYNKYVGDVSSDIATNLANAMASAANNSKTNIQGMINNANAARKSFEDLAKQVEGAGQGKVTGGSSVVAGASGIISNKFSSVNTAKGSTFSDFKKADAADFQLKDYVSKVTLDKSSYLAAIDKIDAQIALIKTQSLSPLKEYSSGKYADKKDKKKADKKEYSKIFDWMAVAVERVNDAISKLGETASNVYKSWSTRNNALSKELTNLVDLLDLQQTTYASYISQANSVGLSSNYKNLVENGAISIEEITNEDLANKIEEYQKWYNAAQDALSDIQKTEKQISDIMAQKFDNIASEYDNKLSLLEARSNSLDKLIDMHEKRGLLSSKKYYEYLQSVESENLALLNQERDALKSSLDEALNSGAIVQYSEQWYDMVNSINDVDSAILDANNSLLEFQNTMRQISWDNFDYLQDKISEFTTEADFLASLLENKKLYDDNGNMTNDGNALMGLHGINYNAYMTQADDYAKSIKNLDKEFENDPLNKDYLERRAELVKLQQDLIQNANGEIDAMKDIVADGYNSMLDALQKLIEAKKNLLSIDKDYYSYQKQVQTQTENIAMIQKKLSSYNGDNSEEVKKTVQQLKIELQQAKDNLEEAEYDKYISDQERLLDKVYDDVEEWVNERLDNIDALLTDMIDNINQNSSQIGETIKGAADNVGYTLSDSFKNVVESTMGANGNISNLLTNYNNNFTDKMSIVNGTLTGIKTLVQGMVDKANAEAAAKAEAEAKRQQQAQTPAPSPTPPSSGNNGSGNTPSGGNGGNGGSSKDTSFFVYKKDSYPKNKLKVDTSVVDRLKFRDIDSSFSKRKFYYGKMNLGGSYTGSASQNSAMIKWLRQNGMYRGGTIKQMVGQTNDDGFFLGRKDEEVVTKENLDKLRPIFDRSEYLAKLLSDISIKTPEVNSGFNSAIIDNINLDITLPNVENYQQLRQGLIEDKYFDKVILSKVNSALTGANSYNYKKYNK